MLKIGVVDYYLDNWHANEYPAFVRAAIERRAIRAEITAAFALKDGTVSNKDWCRTRNIELAKSMDELIHGVDAIMVIAADDSKFHDIVCPDPLQSGKPVFVDKTFAYDVKTAKYFFQIAKKYKTPVFSSSAQRYCQQLIEYLAENNRTRFMSAVGPHSLDNYAVHQLEPIVAVMGTDIKRLKAFAVSENVTHLIIDYNGGRLATFTLSPQPWAEFNFMVSDGKTGRRIDSDDRNFYANLSDAMINFFITGKTPVPEHETTTIISIIETARIARTRPDEWMPLVR